MSLAMSCQPISQQIDQSDIDARVLYIPNLSNILRKRCGRYTGPPITASFRTMTESERFVYNERVRLVRRSFKEILQRNGVEIINMMNTFIVIKPISNETFEKVSNDVDLELRLTVAYLTE